MDKIRKLDVMARLLVASLCWLVLAFPAGAAEWNHVGLEGAMATSLEAEPGLVFVTEVFGVHYLDVVSGHWTSHLDSLNVPMYTALTRYPPQPSRVVLGGGTPIFTGYLALSDDMGENVQFITGISSGTVTDMATSYSYGAFHLLASTAFGEYAPGKLLRSKDGGFSWQEMTGHLHSDLSAVAAIDTNEIWVAGDAQVTRTLDGGQTWESFCGNLNPALPVQCFWTSPGATGLPDKGRPGSDTPDKDEPQSCAALLLASNADGLFLAYPDTADWRQILPDPCRAAVGSFRQESTFVYWFEIVAVTLDGRVLYARSFDDYQVWEDWTDGIAPAVPLDVGVAERYYVLTEHSGVFRTNLPVSDVPRVRNGLELTAYPNPFNPVTTILYDLPRAARVDLAIFDVSGHLVRTLSSAAHEEAGKHEAVWFGCDDSGRPASSGTYLCRLTAGPYAGTRRMVLVK